MIGMEVRIRAPRRCLPGTCEYVALHEKRDFRDVIRVMDLEVGRLSWLTQVGLKLITKVLIREEGGRTVDLRGQTEKDLTSYCWF